MKTVQKGNPSKQGLKQCPVGLTERLKFVQKGNPSKQVLKLISVVQKQYIPRRMVQKGNPSKQGLKQNWVQRRRIGLNEGPKR